MMSIEEEIKEKSRLSLRTYRENLITGRIQTPEQYLETSYDEKEVKEFVLPYLHSTLTWYNEVKDLYDDLDSKVKDLDVMEYIDLMYDINAR